MQAALKAATSGPSSRHMISGLVSIDRPCSEYSGNTTRSMVPRLRLALPTMLTIRSVCRARSALVATTGSCSWTSPMTTPSGDLLRPPSPFMASSCCARHCETCGHFDVAIPRYPATTVPIHTGRTNCTQWRALCLICGELTSVGSTGIMAHLSPIITVDAEPAPIALHRPATALLIIDMQRDFMEPGGFGETLG